MSQRREMQNLIGNGGIDEEEEKVKDKRKRKEDNKEEKRKKRYREKGMKELCWEKKKEKNEEINFAMLVVAGSSRERSKKEYLRTLCHQLSSSLFGILYIH